MKKILFILPSLIMGGLEKTQIALANTLAEKNYDVTVMTLEPDYTLAQMLHTNVQLLYKPYKSTIMKKIPYIRHKLYDDGMWETRTSSRKLHRYYVGNEKFDVEIAFFRGLPIKIVSGGESIMRKIKNFFRIDYQKKSRCVRLAWVHSDFEKATGYANNFKSMKHVRAAYVSFDKVICVSKQAQESFKSVIGDTQNLTTIYNLLPVEQIQKQARKPCMIPVKRHMFNLVLVGRLLDSAKGDVRLISAVKFLQEEGLDIGLVFVGDGPDRDMIVNKIQEYQAEKYVQLVGVQKNPYPYIRQADLLVCASYFEGYNLTVAEALICGTPVLSTDCTGPNEILDNGKYGMIVENSEEGLKNGIRELVLNPEKLAHYREMAAQRMPFFEESILLQQIENLWNKC